MKDRFYGIGEPLVEREKDTGVPAERYLDLVEGLGCTALRSWMHLTDLLLDPHTPNEPVVASHRVLLERAAELDIEVTGMSHEWFLPEGVGPGKGHVLPRRDLRGSSDYMRTMHLLEESWCTMAGLFPEVSQWEVGNEWNNNIFLQPIGLDQGEPAFSPDEKMDIAVDLMYFSARGIRRGNPKAKVVSFSPNFSHPFLGDDLPPYLPIMYGIAYTLDRIYARIKSGRFWSTNTDDYFDLLAWHPYQMSNQFRGGIKEMFTELERPDSLWKDYNDAAYRVMCKYGDGNKQVLLTEVGFTDCGDPKLEREQAQYTRDILQIARQLPYVRTIHNFRLLEESGMVQKANAGDHSIGGMTEVYFGMFTEPAQGCRPREKALVLQQEAGGTGDLAAIGAEIARDAERGAAKRAV